MELIITIPDDISNRVINSAALNFGFKPGGDLSAEDFLSDKVLLLLRNATAKQEGKDASTTSLSQLNSSIDSARVLKGVDDIEIINMTTAIPDSNKPL